uniref:Uncharacterized protein n=1 Tax=Rhizophora mucronata TaxID=61149 RepID=A0A2P2LDQ1_RHIMU
MFFDPYGYHGTSFEQTYRCYPASFIEKVRLSLLLLFFCLLLFMFFWLTCLPLYFGW